MRAGLRGRLSFEAVKDLTVNLGESGVNWRPVNPRRFVMKRYRLILMLGFLMLAAAPDPAAAAPPTVQPSPGYDARLQEQRAAMQAATAPRRYVAPAMRYRAKRHHRMR
jgi:hypothetical protein